MSEIQDAAQIIKVSFEGAEIILKMGNTGWQCEAAKGLKCWSI